MKRYLLILLFIPYVFTLSAQEKPSFVSLQAGASFPVGKFYSKSLPDGGFAQTGFSTSLEGAWFFTSWLGVGASAGIHLHPVDIIALRSEKLSDDPFLVDLSIRSDPYRSFTLYAGAFFQFPVAKKLSITAKALGGAIYAETPYQLYKADYYLLDENWFEVTAAGDYKASFLTGAGLKYDLNGCLALALNTEFTYNSMEFQFYRPDGSIRTDKKVFAFVNTIAGVVIKIPELKP
jgi:hypothetical protein